LEGLLVLFAHIFTLSQAIEIVDQVHEFFILLVIVEGDYWNAIVQLVPKRIHCIVDDDQVFHGTIGDYPQVLDVDPFFSSYAMVPIQSVLYQLSLWIEQVKHHIGIGFVAGSEDNHLIVLIGLHQALQGVWPHIDPCLHLVSIRKRHSY